MLSGLGAALGGALLSGRAAADGFPLDALLQSSRGAGKAPDSGQKPPARRVPRPARTLAAPDFELLHERTPFLAGVRPHRDDGVRLAMARPVEAAGGALKHVVHNYGHGGGGISMSFGTANRARDLVRRVVETHFADRPPAIAVLGAGVAGLTTAMALSERWPEAAITIYARDCDPRCTTSWVAGGQFAPASTLPDSDGAHLDASERHIEELERRGIARRYGIARRTAYSLDGGGGTLLRLGKASRTAREYSSLLIDPTRLLPALNADLAGRGVRVVARELRGRADVYALPEPIVVNCTGFGARDLFGDDTVEARRGHLVLLRNTVNVQYFLNSWCGSGGRIRYLFGRHDDIVIGGSIRPGADVASFDPDIPDDVTTCRRLLANARALFEAPGESCA